MRYPEFLNPGGRIGFIAPSFGCTDEPYSAQFSEAKRCFEAMGYRTVEGPNCRRSDGIGKSSTPENCGAEINDFFLNDRCDCIISCGGGETMCEDLPLVDFEAIAAAKPKWFCGYSDNTALAFTLPVLTDTAAIYGRCAGGFAMHPWHKSIQDHMNLMTGKCLTVHSYEGWERESVRGPETPFAPYNITEDFKMVIWPEDCGRVELQGRLLGGCLDCLRAYCGTSFDHVRAFSEKYADDGILWFFEACDLNPMNIRTSLWQLENAGWFEHVSGFLVGRPLHFGEEMMGMNHINAVTGILSKYKVPILMDLDIGHLPPGMPLIEGAFARVRAEEGKITVEMELK